MGNDETREEASCYACRDLWGTDHDDYFETDVKGFDNANIRYKYAGEDLHGDRR